MFRQLERWLHQHIFKVGWLLCNSFPVATLLYYILFLPGIALREASLWLAATALRARAERSLQLPAAQEIGELRLNVVRLSPEIGRFKRLAISICPLAAGLAALYAIASHVFHWEALLALLAGGSADDLAAALEAVLGTADVWLWLYLAFAIANTMFPTRDASWSPRAQAIAYIALTLLAAALWRVGGDALPPVAAAIEALAAGLGLILAQITIVNICALIALGILESLIESLSSRSATFRDGKMITTTGDETRAADQDPSRDSLDTAPAKPSSKAAPALRSIYDLKLPIPGPPGREPVSRKAVALVMPSQESASPPPVEETEQTAASALPAADAPPKRFSAPDLRIDSQDAPFARPFVSSDAPAADDDWLEADISVYRPDADELFSRPFAVDARASKDDQPSLSQAEDTGSPASDIQPLPGRAVNRPRRTRPAPKPSQRHAGKSQQADSEIDGELTYEPLDDDDLT